MKTDSPTPSEVLMDSYNDAMAKVAENNSIIQTTLLKPHTELLDEILSHSEKAKAVLTVIITSLTYKILNPTQDIRKHQASIPEGYSGRSFDSRYVTPFMKEQKFPAMSSSGWLTRAFEQKVPYDKSYSGAITPKDLKKVFLEVIHNIENGIQPGEYLSYLMQGLIIKRNSQSIDLAKPIALPISTILSLLAEHFGGKYTAEGASRLPVIAIYAAYQCLINEVKRFDNKELLAMESHTSSDKSSGRIGDIDVINKNGREFEAVEVKYGIPITLQLVKDAFSKFQTTPVDRYYILSTVQTNEQETKLIEDEIKRIKNIHGCQVIVNGIMPTLKYYLRLLDNSFEFINSYVNLLEEDAALKFEHKLRWNELIASMD